MQARFDKEIKWRRLLIFISVGILTEVALIALDFLKPDIPIWLQRTILIPSGIILWLEWKLGIQGVWQIIGRFTYFSVIAGMVGCIQMVVKSKGVRSLTLSAFILLFLTLSYFSMSSFFKDVERLGTLYVKKLGDPEFARDFFKDDPKLADDWIKHLATKNQMASSSSGEE